MKIEVGSTWLPRASSTIAAEYDTHWAIVSWASAILFVIVIVAMFYFVWRYRRRSEHEIGDTLDHNIGLEVFWTVIPTVLLLWLFFVGLKGFLNASVAPADSFEIHGIGEKWRWTFTYPNGTTTLNELRVPVGRPVKVILSSKDVIHSFFIPQFRVKQDAVPGAYTSVWFEATHSGETALECTQYCGAGHSDMLAQVVMMEEPKFNDWLENGGDDGGKNVPPAEMGKKLYVKASCETCHSTDGSIKTGPSFKGVFGRQEHLADGSTITVDENYIRESILSPQAKVVQGFPPVMPTFKGLLNDKQIESIIAFLKSQK